jgi:tetratricopeptide (TPR) repeat protein
MGIVHAAQDLLLHRRVAVKLLPPEIQSDAAARERLRAEALAAAALDHPFICKIHEIGQSGERLFIVMEYVEGSTLHAVSERQVLASQQIVEIAIEIAEALDEAHRRGLIHRDLKPSNIMLTSQGHVKVMDFGLAKQLAQGVSGAGVGPAALTEPGVRVGTTAYMSPEQALGGPLDPRSDVFSLGVILYELASGRHPFAREEASDTIAAILCDPPSQGLRDLDTLPGLGALVGKMLAKACAQRPQSMRELKLDLEALRERARSSGSSGGQGMLADAPAERTPFVGRDAERAELAGMLDSMLAGRGGCVLIGGEPGVGKTRLARELMKVARQRGCLCLTGHCYEMEGAPSFVPFVEIVEESARLVPVAVRTALGDAAPEIASMVPSLRRSYADIPPLPDLPAEERRRLVFGAFVEYTRRGTQKSPSVLLLDDLHWADEPSLQLLTYLAPQLQSMRLLIVGTYRDVELDVGRPFAKTLEALLRQRTATRVSMRRLDESAVARMLASLGGSAPPSELARAVFRETEGNPFFIEEVYRHLNEEGQLFDEPGHWKPGLRAGGIAVPESVRLVVGRRLERLGDQARKVLTAAAVIGRVFPLEVLNAAVDVAEDDVLDALEEAERAQLIAIQPARRSVRYGFVHELIRTTLTGALSLPRRQRLHLRIADALERSGAASGDRGPWMLAHHLYQAGAAADVQRTAAALGAALHGAAAAGAFEDVLELSDSLLALELVDNDAHVADAFEQRGTALAGVERYDAAISAWERALASYTLCRDDTGIARTTFVAASNLLWLARIAEAAAIARRGLDALSADAIRERITIQIILARAVSVEGSIGDAAEHIASAAAAAERIAQQELLGLAIAGQAANEGYAAEYSAAIETGKRALTLLGQDSLYTRVNVVIRLAMDYWQSGRFGECEALLSDLEPLARRAYHHGALWNTRGIRTGIALARGGDLRAHLARVEAQVQGPRFTHLVMGELGLTRLYLGDEERGCAELLEALKIQPPKHWYAGILEAWAFVGAALVGRRDQARVLVPTLERLLPEAGRKNAEGSLAALSGLVVGCALLGDRTRCASLYPLVAGEIAPDRHLLMLSTFTGSHPQLSAALAAEAAAFPEKASEHFEAALEHAQRIPIRLLQPVTRFWYGRTLAERPSLLDRERGRSMLVAALDDFRTLAMVPYARLAEAALKGET